MRRIERKGNKRKRRSLPVRVRACTENPARNSRFSVDVRSQCATNRTSGRRERIEGARQDDFGRRHFRPSVYANYRPWVKHQGDSLYSFPFWICGYQLGIRWVLHAIAWRKWQQAMTGESSTLCAQALSPLYKPSVKRDVIMQWCRE